MGKLILIQGENNSGKSRFAEELIAQTTGPRYYIATMQPHTEENHRRIQKHIQQRAHLNFTTLELPLSLREAAVPKEAVVLLEDVANLLSNAIFAGGGDMEVVWKEILFLRESCQLLVAVTIFGLNPEDFFGETADYIRFLNELNRRLAAHSDAAVTMADRVPVWEKGDAHAIL